MAVYHATRRAGPLGPRSGVAPSVIVRPLPGLRPRPAPGTTQRAAVARPGTLARRSGRDVHRAGLHPERVGLLLALISVAFVLAFFSLAQTIRISASTYDADRLGVERSRLEGQRQELLSDLNRLGHEPAVRKSALELGLAPLVAPLEIPAK